MTTIFSRNLSIRSRLLLTLILVSALSAMVLIAIGYYSGKKAITAGIFNQLTGIRAAKQYQVESYFKEMSGIVEVLGSGHSVKTALREFKRGFQLLGQSEINANCSNQLSSHYISFVDRLSQNLSIKSSIDLYYPNTVEACYLQYEYIIDNPNQMGEKHLLTDAGDGSEYNDIHKRYHTYFSNIIQKFGFYDLFLIDLERGDIVYSVYKETDFATNLFTGPYRESNLAQLARQLRTNRDIQKPIIIDFDTYRPSYGAPAAFIGISVTDGMETIGALVFQLPVDEINRIMTGNFNWENDGLGKSGETYLVGEDFMMRSISRFYLQDTVGYKQALMDLGADPLEVEKTYRIGTTILQQRVKTEAVSDALAGNIQTRVVDDYRNLPVLSAYAPLKIEGLNWVMLSEIDLAEANAPIHQFEKQVFIALCIILLLVTFLSMYLAGRFVKPVEQLTEGVHALAAGDFKRRIPINTKDEFGELSNAFNSMIENIEGKQHTIARQSSENEKLLLNFVPETIARRLQKGEKLIVDDYPNVSLIAVDISGFSNLTQQLGAKESIQLLNALVEAFDAAALKYQVEKLRTVGDTYFAACGMFTPRLDHANKILDFAREVRQLIIQFNINHKVQLKLHIGMHAGPVVAGIVGAEKFNFDLWGQTVSKLFKIKNLELDDAILISAPVYHRLSSLFVFEKVELPAGFESLGEVWAFSGQRNTI